MKKTDYYYYILDALKKTKEELTENWKETNVYNQNHGDVYKKSDCGCALHFLYLAHLSVDSAESWQTFITTPEYEYIYGFTSEIIEAARTLKFPEPTRFEREDAVERIDFIISELQGEPI